MLRPMNQVARVITLLSQSLYVIALPSELIAPRSLLDVPWKKTGLPRLINRDYGTCKNGPTSRGCWSGNFDIDTDMDLSWPDTGNTVTYTLDVQNVTMAPDGFSKQMFAVNGQYPGPTIEANWGDTISVTVKNSLTANGTGIHWHGFRQLGTNEMDGVPGITECPISPGESRTYTFKATQYGTSWYHSHYSAQYGDGVLGPIVINGPSTANYDIDLGVLTFTDWFHTPYFTVNAAALHANGPPIADNALVNGSMTSDSGGKYAETFLTPGKKHKLRLVNTGSNNWFHVGLDGHPFEVVASDFVPIKPYTATSVNIAVGQRYEVIIDANQPVGNYWLRVGTGGGKCDGPNKNAANIRSIFRYAGSSSGDPTSSANGTLPTGCYDETVVPHVNTTVPSSVPTELELGFSTTTTADHAVQWLINGSALVVDYLKPTLYDAAEGNTSFPSDDNLYQVGKGGGWSYWVIQQDPNSPTAAIPHPIHLHGHDFYVLESVSNAQWSGDTSKLILNNPIRRDTVTLQASGYLVLAFESDNPGVWLMHCHIPFHLSQGLGLQFEERASDINSANPGITTFSDSCASWAKVQAQLFPNGTQGGGL